jgi:hypothetical protein
MHPQVGVIKKVELQTRLQKENLLFLLTDNNEKYLIFS